MWRNDDVSAIFPAVQIPFGQVGQSLHWHIFFGHTFNLVLDSNAYVHVPCHTLCVLRPLMKDVLNMIEQNDCQEDSGCKKNCSSGDFKLQSITTMYFNEL